MTLKKSIAISLISVLILSGLLFMLLIKPTFVAIKENAQQSISQREKLKALEEKIQNIERFKQNRSQIKESLEIDESLFAKAEAPVNLIEFLEQIAQDSQVSIKISPSGAIKQPEDAWSSIIFQIAAASSFPNFLKFLEKIESSSYLVLAKQLNIQQLTENDIRLKEYEGLSTNDIKANLAIKAFAQ